MYHHEDSSTLLSSRTTFLPERHLFLQGGNTPGDSGLVLSTDAKPRLKWTPELHEHFKQAVKELGGPDKATPKTIMNLMGIPGLTLYHLKSHLQKYRLSKNLQAQANIGDNKYDPMLEESTPVQGTLGCGSQTNKSMDIGETLHLQIGETLHLPVQKHLQLRIEAQGKYLRTVLEKAKQTLEKQNDSSPGLEDAKEQLSQLASKVSNECLSTAFPHFQEAPNLLYLQQQANNFAECSLESCLTSSDRIQKDQELPNLSMKLNTNNGFPTLFSRMGVDFRRHQSEDELNGSNIFGLSMMDDSRRNVPPVLSMTDTSVMEEKTGSAAGSRRKLQMKRFLVQESSKQPTVQHEIEEEPAGFKLQSFIPKLDLNAGSANQNSIQTNKFDLNCV